MAGRMKTPTAEASAGPPESEETPSGAIGSVTDRPTPSCPTLLDGEGPACQGESPVRVKRFAHRQVAPCSGVLSRRLPEPRRGDSDPPHRGRAESGAHGALRAHPPPGRGDPRDQAPPSSQARGDEDPGRAGRAPGRAGGPGQTPKSKPKLRGRVKEELLAGAERLGDERHSPLMEAGELVSASVFV